MISKIITSIKFCSCIVTILFTLLFSYNAIAQNYAVGVPVCDTVVANMELDFTGEFVLIQLDSSLVPYVMGLNFKVKITDIHGFVFSNVKDTLQVGDMQTLPVNSDSGVLKINVPGNNNFVKFDILIVGIPLVAGEVYSCNISYSMTTAVCCNTLEVCAEDEKTCIVQPNTSIDHEQNEYVPEKFKLNQNYPNPFTPQTTIEYTLPKKVFVELKIYNIIGQEIKTLVQKVQEAGAKSVTWDVTNNNGMTVPSGIYIYRIVLESYSKALTFVLLE
jgi:hypothetical protein